MSGDSEAVVVLNMGTSTANVTLGGLTAGDYGLWLDSETIAQGVSRKQVTLGATQSLTLEAKGYRVFVKGTFSEESITIPEPGPEPQVYTPTLDSADEVSIFFETPTATSYAVWVWGDLGGGEAYCANPTWPGDALTLMGLTQAGNSIYKYVITKVSVAPQYLIISKNNGNNKIYDGVTFVNHGYYVEGKTTPTRVITALATKRGDLDGNGDVDVQDLSLLIDVVLGKRGTDDAAIKGDCHVAGGTGVDVADVSALITLMLGQ